MWVREDVESLFEELAFAPGIAKEVGVTHFILGGKVVAMQTTRREFLFFSKSLRYDSLSCSRHPQIRKPSISETFWIVNRWTTTRRIGFTRGLPRI